MVTTKTTSTTFVWKPKEWKKRRIIHPDITLMHRVDAAQIFIVKKVLHHIQREEGFVRNFEIRALTELPNCNRIVQMLAYQENTPEEGSGTIVYNWYPLGDVYHWKHQFFDDKNFKPVPESYIWRFYVQMTQALAFIHNRLGPGRDMRTPIIHRDIKPRNFLVVHNGTTYPSFKLHDFGCGTFLNGQKSEAKSYCGTHEWQPPENPLINTEAADVWSLGACVHYLALGKAPISSVGEFSQEMINEYGTGVRLKAEIDQGYSSFDRYCAAHVPRNVVPINLPREEQMRRGLAPRSRGPKFNPVYSDELNAWMHAALIHRPDKRVTTGRLLRKMVPEARHILKGLGGNSALTDLDITF